MQSYSFVKGKLHWSQCKSKYCVHTYLDEADVLGVLAEALAADIQAVLADQAPLVGAYTAAKRAQSQSGSILYSRHVRFDHCQSQICSCLSVQNGKTRLILSC